MTTYYNNSIDYHNDLDAFEARVRAEPAETEYEIGRRIMKQIIADENKPQCICLEIIGDNGYCPVHGNGLEKRMEEIKADYFTDYGANYQERNDLYIMGMGG